MSWSHLRTSTAFFEALPEQADFAPEEKPRELIARGVAEEDVAVKEQEEPRRAELPLSLSRLDDASPQIKRRRLLAKTTVAGDSPVRESPLPAAAPKATDPNMDPVPCPAWWIHLKHEEKAKHVEELVKKRGGWKAYQAHVLARDGRLSMPTYFSKLNHADKRLVVGFWLSGAGADGAPAYLKT